MTRLPTVGSDTNTWGALLNAFLSVGHNGDGTFLTPMQVGTGTPDPYTGSGATITPQTFSTAQGSDGSPVTTSGPTARIGRVEQLAVSSIGGSGTQLTNEANAALVVTSTGSGSGTAGSYMQTCAIFAYARATDTGTWDAIGFNSLGRVTNNSTRRGTGGYFEGRADATGGTLVGAEIRANNQKSSVVANDSLFRGTGQSDTCGLFVSSAAAGTANPTIAAGIQIYSADGVGQFGVGIGIANTGVNAIDTRSGTFSDATIALGNGQKIGWENAGGSGTIKCLYLDSSNRLNFDNSIANPGILISSGTNIQLSTGTGTQLGTGSTQKLGFWGVTPVVQPQSTGNTHTVTAGSTTNVFTNTTFDGSTGSSAYTVGDIVLALKQTGILKS